LERKKGIDKIKVIFVYRNQKYGEWIYASYDYYVLVQNDFMKFFSNIISNCCPKNNFIYDRMDSLVWQQDGS